MLDLQLDINSLQKQANL